MLKSCKVLETDQEKSSGDYDCLKVYGVIVLE